MQVDIHGLTFETPATSFHLWSPWRCSYLEHRLFESVRAIPNTQFDHPPDEFRLLVHDPKTFRQAIQAIARTLKGWEEEASDTGTEERRAWRWLIEADTDAAGYDHTGEPASIWGFIRLLLERRTPGEPERVEEIDLDGFGVRIEGLGHRRSMS